MQNPKQQLSLLEFVSQKKFSDEDYRFMQDLEFVQDLSNVFYLKCIWFVL